MLIKMTGNDWGMGQIPTFLRIFVPERNSTRFQGCFSFFLYILKMGCLNISG